jgi:hypothetical protein
MAERSGSYLREEPLRQGSGLLSGSSHSKSGRKMCLKQDRELLLGNLGFKAFKIARSRNQDISWAVKMI